MDGTETQTLTVAVDQREPIPLTGRLTVPAGKLVALVGPSGAGKSSLLRIVAGLLRPQHGVVKLGASCWLDTERRVWLPPEARHVGMLFQHYALMPHCSAEVNVAMALWRLPRRDRQRLARAWLERVGLPESHWHRLPNALSGGEQQRVALARALAAHPKVLLLDEPFSAVDALRRSELYALLATLRQELTMPIVMVTHDLMEARLLADEIAVIDRGELLQQGPTEHLYRSPRNARVAAILGIRNRFVGRWLGPDPLRPGWGRLEWRAHTERDDAPVIAVLPARDKGRIPLGQAVHWVVQNDALTLRTCDAPPCPGNPVRLAVTVTSVRSSGDFSLVEVALTASPQLCWQITLTGRERHRFQVGESAFLCLDPSWIHVMPIRRR
ncbi:ABC transporter ATP-binding protein [Hydrogenophilus thermoluteolus]|uniref:ABC transporter n=1 Tax=Hydrogenophilus thermoluteolus TaxID=297 RepID=A0A2Z6E0K1_HYDTE|nr:ABC transporter ATP-binding protein [Hydrogenophilus thermoluteolus]BBD78283.1 ABC transporter [Hydrogenophilus thermoluteolus]